MVEMHCPEALAWVEVDLDDILKSLAYRRNGPTPSLEPIGQPVRYTSSSKQYPTYRAQAEASFVMMFEFELSAADLPATLLSDPKGRALAKRLESAGLCEEVSMSDAPSQRRFSRVPLQIFVEIRNDDICLSSNKTHDVSMKGLFVHTGKTLPIGTPCQVRLMLEGNQGEQSIELRGQVVRVTNAGMAVEFCDSNVESYQRLRSLILFNAPDAAQAQKEIDGHPGFKLQS